ncbi:hypothetical protein CAL7716_102640 (plasmid) [Calothrix sp. PCC 7716]|nr:hypothetical protein CAL7716_102640 [Calothrix sp. PCC 7716]
MRSLNYWGCDYANPLISYIAKHYNELQNIDERDRFWLLGRLGSYYWLRWCDSPPSPLAEKARNFLEELPKHQLYCLIQAIGNKSAAKPLGYYSCDYTIPLIKFFHDFYGDLLQNMSEVDQTWLLGMMGDFYYQLHCEGDIPASDTADEVTNNLHQLDRNNCSALIQALTNI